MSFVPTSPFDRLHVVLVSPRNPLNIGAAARAMSNFGFNSLRVVNPYELAFREARSAVGASHILTEAKQFNSVADAVADCTVVIGTTAIRHRELQHPLRDVASAGRVIRKQLASNHIALLFGSERWGLSNDELSHCHWLMNVPTPEKHPSMNLGQAVAVCLYELIRSGAPKTRLAKIKTASAVEIERLTSLLVEILRSSGYIKSQSGASADERVRRFVRRLELSPEDAITFIGMLRQIRWKVNS